MKLVCVGINLNSLMDLAVTESGEFINSRKVLLKYSGSYNLIKPECFNDLLYKFNLVIEKSIELFKYLLTDFNYFLYKIKNLKRKL